MTARADSSQTVEVTDAASLRPLLVTSAEAARILSIGRTAVYQLIWSGELTPIHIGRSVRISIDELETFVQRRLEV